MSASALLQLLFSGVTVGSIYALTALGFNLIYNATGIINFAQGEFVMLGGMTAAWLAGMGLPLWSSFVVSVALVAALGASFERLCIHPLRSPQILSLIMITIAGSILFRGAAMFLWGKQTVYLKAFSGERPIRFLGAALHPQTLWVLGTALVITICLHLFLRYTLLGKAMRACASNRTAARLTGIPVDRIVLLSFTLSAGIGAAGGVVVTPITLMDYQQGTLLGLKGFSAAVLGGLGNPNGAVAAGLMIGALESLSAGLISSHYKDAVALVALLAVLCFRPEGIWGTTTRR